MDLYKTLGVKKDASKEEVKRAYRKKAKESHPDRKGGDAEAMKEVNRAYAVLGDTEKREQYDRTGDTGPRQPTLEERAMQSLARAFDTMLADEAQVGNIVDIVAKAIRDSIKTIQVEIKKYERYLEKLDKKSSLVTKKSADGVNLWSNVVAGRRARYELAIVSLKDNLEVAGRASEILAEYEGKAPPEEQKPKRSSLDDFLVSWS